MKQPNLSGWFWEELGKPKFESHIDSAAISHLSPLMVKSCSSFILRRSTKWENKLIDRSILFYYVSFQRVNYDPFKAVKSWVIITSKFVTVIKTFYFNCLEGFWISYILQKHFHCNQKGFNLSQISYRWRQCWWPSQNPQEAQEKARKSVIILIFLCTIIHFKNYIDWTSSNFILILEM